MFRCRQAYCAAQLSVDVADRDGAGFWLSARRRDCRDAASKRGVISEAERAGGFAKLCDHPRNHANLTEAMTSLLPRCDYVATQN